MKLGSPQASDLGLEERLAFLFRHQLTPAAVKRLPLPHASNVTVGTARRKALDQSTCEVVLRGRLHQFCAIGQICRKHGSIQPLLRAEAVKDHSLIDAGSACDHTGSRSRKALCGELFESSGYEFLPGSIQIALFSHCSPSTVCVLFFSIPQPFGASFALPIARVNDGCASPAPGKPLHRGQAVIEWGPICEAGLIP